ncbi:MAG TPA: alpha/beta hydrolase [Pseudonocardia sp.]
MTALAAAAAVGAALLGAPAAQAAPAPGYQPPAVVWGKCAGASLAGAGAQCGFVTVPLDYANPGGEKIKIAVSRIKHKVPDAKAQGPMLVNPGGPGGSGLALAALGQAVPNHAGDAYDWIGFDPRGVGSSRPALSCIPTYGGFDRPEYDPAKAPNVAATWLAKASKYAAACATRGGNLLNHLTTADAAKDMDSIRKALGAKQINYYGFSYGTYLGQVYATLFPQNLRRVVFDGVVDPRGVWYQDNLGQDVAFQKTIEIYFDWVAKHDATYHLGNTGQAVEKLYYSEQDKLRAHPAGGQIGPSEWTDIFLQAGYYVFGWADTTAMFSDWVHHQNLAELKAAFEHAGSVSDDNGYAIYLSVQCTDTQWPRSVPGILADNTRVARTAPFETWGNAWYNAPCSYWKAPAAVPVQVSGRGVPPILMVNETFDAATPYSGALETRRVFPGSVLIEGVGGTTHAGSLSGVACTDNTIAAYLATGALPTRVAGNRSDKRCDPVPPPPPIPPVASPTPAGAGSSAATTKARAQVA